MGTLSLFTLGTGSRIITNSRQFILYHERGLQIQRSNSSRGFKYLTFQRQRHKLSAPTVLYLIIYAVVRKFISLSSPIASCPLDLPSEGRMRLPLSAGGGTQPPPPLFGFGEVRICCIRVHQKSFSSFSLILYDL